MRRSTRPTESVADFKQRIAIMMRERETGKKYSIVGAARAHDCVIRKHTQYGTNKPSSTT